MPSAGGPSLRAARGWGAVRHYVTRSRESPYLPLLLPFFLSSPKGICFNSQLKTDNSKLIRSPPLLLPSPDLAPPALLTGAEFSREILVLQVPRLAPLSTRIISMEIDRYFPP